MSINLTTVIISLDHSGGHVLKTHPWSDIFHVGKNTKILKSKQRTLEGSVKNGERKLLDGLIAPSLSH